MTRPRIGAMRHHLTLEAVARSPDGGGGVTESWTSVADVWAAVIPVTGGESVVGEGVSGRITHVVFMRWRADVTPAMRLRFGTRLLDITAVIDVEERGRHLKCLCRERDL